MKIYSSNLNVLTKPYAFVQTILLVRVFLFRELVYLLKSSRYLLEKSKCNDDDYLVWTILFVRFAIQRISSSISTVIANFLWISWFVPKELLPLLRALKFLKHKFPFARNYSASVGVFLLHLLLFLLIVLMILLEAVILVYSVLFSQVI